MSDDKPNVDNMRDWKAEYDKLLEFATYWHQKAIALENMQHVAQVMGHIFGQVQRPGPIVQALPPELIERLANFVHPDRHSEDKKEKATALFQDLMKLRKP